MTDTTKLLRELIALPSVNPSLVAVDHPRAGEQDAIEFAAATAAAAGLDIEFQEAAPGRSNLLARLSPTGIMRHRIILAPHLDTVDGTEDQFVPLQRGDRLFGRGSCDTKGSVAAMLGALCDLARSHCRPASTEILFAGLIDEEHGQLGSRALARSGIRADMAIVGEPTQLKVVTAHKGSLWLRITTRGRAAHGAWPEQGDNAVYKMASVIQVLENDYAASLKRRAHPLLGPPTISVGVVQGGTQPNIVPNSCHILIDRRTLPGETARSVMSEIKTLLAKRKLAATVQDEKVAECPPMQTDVTLPAVSEFLSRNGQKQPEGARYFCDAAVLAGARIPSVVFGPGDIAQAHTADEWVSLKAVDRARRTLLNYFSGLA
jgi:acetylornithine deacetylase/succinyl-diaminopimelate desuccinylase-like protein